MKHGSGGILRRLLLSAAVFAVLLTSLILLLNRLGRRSQEEQLNIVSNSIRNALVTCYAVEGGYPSDLGYLVDHYALTYDEDRIHVYYDAFASNIMPQFKVTLRGDDTP